MKPRGDLEALIERIGRNRSHLSVSVMNLDGARMAAQERRNRRVVLLDEARQSLASLRHHRALLDRSRSVVKPAVPPRSAFAKPGANPVDIDRQRLHERYAATRDPAVRDELMASYDGFARSLALK